jgi:hypothetical protein
MTGVNPKGGIKRTPRDPAWKWRRALGHKVVRSRKVYTRKAKHRAAVCVLVALLVAPVSADAGLKLVKRPPALNYTAATPEPKLAKRRSRVPREEVIIRSPDVQRFTAIIERYRRIQYDVSTYR